eukprot:4099051-Pleurochrysis_carterae.AAC.1
MSVHVGECTPAHARVCTLAHARVRCVRSPLRARAHLESVGELGRDHLEQQLLNLALEAELLDRAENLPANWREKGARAGIVRWRKCCAGAWRACARGVRPRAWTRVRIEGWERTRGSEHACAAAA